MKRRLGLLFCLPLIGALVVGCSEAPKPASSEPQKGPTVAVGKTGKGAQGKRKPKEMGSLLGPETPVD